MMRPIIYILKFHLNGAVGALGNLIFDLIQISKAKHSQIIWKNQSETPWIGQISKKVELDFEAGWPIIKNKCRHYGSISKIAFRQLVRFIVFVDFGKSCFGKTGRTPTMMKSDLSLVW